MLFYYSCPNFSTLPTSAHPTTCSHSLFHTIVHVCGSFIHVLWLVPSPSFQRYPPLPSPPLTFSLLHVSMPVVVFCSLVYFGTREYYANRNKPRGERQIPYNLTYKRNLMNKINEHSFFKIFFLPCFSSFGNSNVFHFKVLEVVSNLTDDLFIF